MKKSILFISFVFVLLGCAHYQTNYAFKSPHSEEGQLCINECRTSKTVCQQQCLSQDPNCLRQVKAEARVEYDAYVGEHAGQPIHRDFNAFYHPEKCAHSGCSCEVDYRACFELCGGQLIPYERCVSHCDVLS